MLVRFGDRIAFIPVRQRGLAFILVSIIDFIDSCEEISDGE